MRIIWSEIAQATFVHFMADQAGMMAVNRAVEALADNPAPPGAFVRGAYRRLRVGPYRVLYEVEGNLITFVTFEELAKWAELRNWGPSTAARNSPAGSGIAVLAGDEAVTAPRAAVRGSRPARVTTASLNDM